MKNFFYCLIFSLLIIFSHQAQAEITGVELLKACQGDIKKTHQAPGKVFCLGYVSGYLDSYMISSEVHSANKKLFCLPAKGLSNTEATQIVVDYLNHNSYKLTQSARSLIILAFIQKFPCK